MSKMPVYLDTYTLQSDLRIRLPKSAIENLGAEPGKTQFKVLINTETNELLLRIVPIESEKRDGR